MQNCLCAQNTISEYDRTVVSNRWTMTDFQPCMDHFGFSYGIVSDDAII